MRRAMLQLGRPFYPCTPLVSGLASQARLDGPDGTAPLSQWSMAPQLTVTATHTFPHLDDCAACPPCPLSPHASSSGTASITSAAFGYSQHLLSSTTSHSISHDVGLKRNLLMEHQTFNQHSMAQLTQRLSNCLPEMFGCSDVSSCRGNQSTG